MKTCPTCNRTYADDSLNFCLDDGATLFDGDASLPTVAFSNRPTDPSIAEIPTQIARLPNLSDSQPPPLTVASSFSPPFQFVPQVASVSKPADNRKYKYLAIAAGLLFFGVVGSLLIAVGLGKWTSGNNSTTNNNSPGYVVSNSNTASNNSNSVSVTNSNTETDQKSEPEFNLVGIWKGKHGGNSVSSTLNILNQNDKTFSGTLNRKDGYVIEFTGVINYEKLTVSMNETKTLKVPKNGRWSLGKNNGVISADGKSMQGKGKDKFTSYPWSFTKE